MNQAESDFQFQGRSRWEKIEFTGKGAEYFKIWIVNIFLSILTLGIYSAWAKVRTRRYFYGNTFLDGSAFEYHATPVMILQARVIAVALLMLVIFIGRVSLIAQVVGIGLIAALTPLVIWRSIIFNARMSSYRNVRFSFARKSLPLYVYLLVLPLLPILIALVVLLVRYVTGDIEFNNLEFSSVTGIQNEFESLSGVTIGTAVFVIYLLVPFIQKATTSYYLNGHNYGQGKFRARLSAAQYYWIYLKMIGLSMIIYLLFVVIATGLFAIFGRGAESLLEQNIAASPLWMSMLPLIFLPIIVALIWLKSYKVTRIRNYSFGKLRLESAITFDSRIKVNRLFWIQLTNILLLVITLGLAYPWTVIRKTRYKLQTLQAHLHGDLGEYVSQMQARQSALGEEIGEAFDLDLDLGL